MFGDGLSAYRFCFHAAYRGVCWNTTGAPTIADSTTTDGYDVGIFTSSITGLDPNTVYYVRAYATNKYDTSYGSVQMFSTLAPSDDPNNANNDPNDVGNDPNDANNDPPTAPDLRVTIAAATTSAKVGEELGFEVKVENVGTASATGVTLRFPLPAGTELVGVWLVPDESAQAAPLNAVVDGDEIVVELGDVSVNEGIQLKLVLKATSAGAVTLSASATCDEKNTPATAQVQSDVEVDDVYVKIIRTSSPFHACGLLGFTTTALMLLGLLALKRRVAR